MSKGPLGIRFGPIPAPAPEAGALAQIQVDVENTGSVAWPDGVFLSYHWLDSHDNPIVWDGVRTTPPPPRAGRAGDGRARRARADPARAVPARPRRRRRASRLVLGARQRDAADRRGGRRAATGEPSATLPPWVEATPAWTEHTRAAHAEGYAVVAGSIDWDGGALRRRPRALEPYTPGTGRVPGVRRAAPLPVGPARGRARAARRRRRPARLRGAARRAVDLRRARGAQSSTAIRSSTDLKTHAASTSETAAATTR